MTSAGKRWPQWRLRDWLISPACTGQPNPAILSQRDNARHQHHRQRGREVYARKVYALHAPEVECIDKSLPLAEPGVSLNTLVTSPKGCKFARNSGSDSISVQRAPNWAERYKEALDVGEPAHGRTLSPSIIAAARPQDRAP